MASKSNEPADESEVAEEVVEQPEPEGEVSAEDQPDADAAPEQEAEQEAEVDEVAEANAKAIAMQHADGNGSCDLYEANEAGHIMVPAAEAHLMLEHGFVVVEQA